MTPWLLRLMRAEHERRQALREAQLDDAYSDRMPDPAEVGGF